MKKTLSHLCLFSVLLLTMCQDDTPAIENNFIGEWVVLSFQDEITPTPTVVDPIYVLTITRELTYGTMLEVNPCGGRYELMPYNQFRFYPAWCEKACCDSKNGLTFLRVLSSMLNYEISNDTITMTGAGMLKMKRVTNP